MNKISNLPNELTFREATQLTGYDVSHLLRVASRGPKFLELLWSVTYSEITEYYGIFTPHTDDTGDYLAIPRHHADELLHRTWTSVQTFLPPISILPKPGLIDIMRQLTLPKQIIITSEYIINLENHLEYIFVTRKSIEKLIADKKKNRTRSKKKPIDHLIDLILYEDQNISAKRAWNLLPEVDRNHGYIDLPDDFATVEGNADKETATITLTNTQTEKIYQPLKFRSFEKKLSKCKQAK